MIVLPDPSVGMKLCRRIPIYRDGEGDCPNTCHQSAFIPGLTMVDRIGLILLARHLVTILKNIGDRIGFKTWLDSRFLLCHHHVLKIKKTIYSGILILISS
jgi:hypothetical protein